MRNSAYISGGLLLVSSTMTLYKHEAARKVSRSDSANVEELTEDQNKIGDGVSCQYSNAAMDIHISQRIVVKDVHSYV